MKALLGKKTTSTNHSVSQSAAQAASGADVPEPYQYIVGVAPAALPDDFPTLALATAAAVADGRGPGNDAYILFRPGTHVIGVYSLARGFHLAGIVHGKRTAAFAPEIVLSGTVSVSHPAGTLVTNYCSITGLTISASAGEAVLFAGAIAQACRIEHSILVSTAVGAVPTVMVSNTNGTSLLEIASDSAVIRPVAADNPIRKTGTCNVTVSNSRIVATAPTAAVNNAVFPGGINLRENQITGPVLVQGGSVVIAEENAISVVGGGLSPVSFGAGGGTFTGRSNWLGQTDSAVDAVTDPLATGATFIDDGNAFALSAHSAPTVLRQGITHVNAEFKIGFSSADAVVLIGTAASLGTGYRKVWLTDTVAPQGALLPAATASQVDRVIEIGDGGGDAAGASPKTITPAGVDTINGVNAAIMIATNFGIRELTCQAVGAWIVTKIV